MEKDGTDSCFNWCLGFRQQRERERWEIKQMRKWPTKTEAICNTHRERCVRGHTHSLYTSDVWCLPLVQCLSIFSSTCSSYLQISPDGLGLPDRNYYYREPDHAVIIHFTTFASRLFSCVRGISKSVPRGQHPLHTTLSRLYNCRYIISTCDSALHFLYSLTFRSVLVILTAFDFDIDIYIEDVHRLYRRHLAFIGCSWWKLHWRRRDPFLFFPLFCPVLRLFFCATSKQTHRLLTRAICKRRVCVCFQVASLPCVRI